MTRAKDISKIVTDADLSGTLDVPGAVRAGGLTVGDGHTLGNDGSDNLEIKSSTGENLLLKTGGAVIQMYNDSDVRYFRMDNGGDISFYEDTGTTPKFFWDASAETLDVDGVVTVDRVINATTSADPWLKGVNGSNTETFFLKPSGQAYFGGNVGIGTSSPSSQLHLSSALPRIYLTDTDTSTTSYLIGDNGWLTFSADTSRVVFNINSSEVMRMLENGNVGIGTSSPDAKLEIKQVDGTPDTGFQITRYNNDNQFLSLWTTGGVRYIDSVGDSSVSSNLSFRRSTNSGSSFSESMRIDSSGNLLVGKTSANTTVEGFQTRAGAITAITRDGNLVLNANRLTSDGDIMVFQKDSTTVGSIGTATRPYFASPDWGVKIGQSGAQGYLEPTNQSGSALDNGINIGASSTRWKDLYLSGGVFLGGTGSANKLEDYEEGTWTPVVSGGTSAGTGTHGVQQGFYTKIGRLVTVNFDYTLTAHTGSGALYIGNLPFNVTSSTGYEAVGTFMSHNFNFSTTSPVSACLYAGAGHSFMRIYITVDNGAWVQQNLDVAHSMIGSLTYMTDS
jgi:hypothetical protein